MRAALDTQRVGADGTPGLWRHQIVGATGRSINRKSGLTFDRVGPAATHLWQSLAWRLPQLAVAEMQAAPEHIVRVTGRPGRVTVLTFEVSPGREVEVSILPSGEVSGYAYLSERLRGQTRTVTRFKPPVPVPGIGRVPRGYTVDIGAIRALDLDLLDARGGPGRDDPWLVTPATDTAPRGSIATSPPRPGSASLPRRLGGPERRRVQHLPGGRG